MEVELKKETSKEIEEAAMAFGMKKQEIIRRAILLYLDELRNLIGLKKELKAWDALSDEALSKLERKL